MSLATLLGSGAVSAAGMGTEALAEGQRVPPRALPMDELLLRDDLVNLRGITWAPGWGGVPAEGFQPRAHIERRRRKLLKMMARQVAWVLAASREATEDAGLTPGHDGAPEKLSVFAGVGFSVDEDNAFMPALDEATRGKGFDLSVWGEAHELINPLWLVRGLNNNALAFTSLLWDARGDNDSFCGCRSAPLIACEEAARSIAEGRSSRSIVVAADTLLNMEHLVGLELQGLLSSSPPSPLGKTSGIVPGEGAAALVLGPAGLAGPQLLGAASLQVGDGGFASPEGVRQGTRRALESACEDAGIDAGCLSFVWTTSAGEPAEAAELQALNDLGLGARVHAPLRDFGDPGAATGGLLLALLHDVRVPDGYPCALLARGHEGSISVLIWGAAPSPAQAD